MKKLIVIFCLALVSCGVDKENNTLSNNGRYGDFKVVEVDHCEYVVYDYGIADQRVFAITHKGNCKNHAKGEQSSNIIIDKTNGHRLLIESGQ